MWSRPQPSGAGFACRQLHGATAGAAVGPGVGANALIGGSSHSFTLQPVSVECQSRFDVSGGLATINLQFAPEFSRTWALTASRRGRGCAVSHRRAKATISSGVFCLEWTRIISASAYA